MRQLILSLILIIIVPATVPAQQGTATGGTQYDAAAEEAYGARATSEIKAQEIRKEIDALLAGLEKERKSLRDYKKSNRNFGFPVRKPGESVNTALARVQADEAAQKAVIEDLEARVAVEEQKLGEEIRQIRQRKAEIARIRNEQQRYNRQLENLSDEVRVGRRMDDLNKSSTRLLEAEVILQEIMRENDKGIMGEYVRMKFNEVANDPAFQDYLCQVGKTCKDGARDGSQPVKVNVNHLWDPNRDSSPYTKPRNEGATR